MFKLQWFKDYLFCSLNPNPESEEDLREISQKLRPKSSRKNIPK